MSETDTDTSEPTKKRTVCAQIPESVYRELKHHIADSGETSQQFVARAIRECIEKSEQEKS